MEFLADQTVRRKPASFSLQARLLIEKNWKCKIRMDRKKLLGELLLPIFYLVILSLMVKLDKKHEYEEVTVSYETAEVVTSSLREYVSQPQIHIVPNTEFSRNFSDVMNSLWLQNHPTSSLDFVFYSDELELEYEYRKNVSVLFTAIVLANDEKNSNYTIRVTPEMLPSLSNKKEGLNTCRGRDRKAPSLEQVITCPVNGYYYSSFLALQFFTEQAFANMESKNDNLTVSAAEAKNISVTVENYPKPSFNAGMSTFMRVLIPMYCVIPLSQLINNLLVLIVTEKETKIKDGLKMIGISDLAYWFSWFMVYGAIVTFFSVVFTTVMYFMSVLRHISPLLLFLLFFTFGLSVVSLSFAITPFFHKPKTAGIVGTLILQFTGSLFLLQTFIEGSGPWLVPLRLISSLAFTTALDDAAKYEWTGGIGWSNLRFGDRGEGILVSLLFLIADTFFYGLLAIYLDNILPNEFGVKKHPLFCCMPSFWRGSKGSSRRPSTVDHTNDEHCSSENIEAIPVSLQGKEAISIYNIKKTFTSWIGSSQVEAVKGISFDIYEGEITAILGRNGAGKSTLINMLTGMVSPTSGTAVIFGHDICDPYGMSQIRKMTGVCMQHDLHFSVLTVEEHLKFYGMIRGLTKDELAAEIDILLQELQLLDRRNTQAQKLSGGQKRKLSVGMALIGDPKIIFLDEPSASIDAVSRRHLWALLQRKKEGKVILLTTHFMDEADNLASRKAIIHEGVLKCLGTSIFLKRRFGVGYSLVVEFKDRNSDKTASDEIVKAWMPSVLDSKSVIANEVKYALPHSEVSKFPPLFAAIETRINSTDSVIKSYGVSMTSLEEVFLRISNNMGYVPSVSAIPNSVENTEHDNVNHEYQELQVDETNLITSNDLLKQNSVSILMAMCRLRVLRLIRNPQSLFFMVFMPAIFVAIGFILVKTQSLPKAGDRINFANLQDIYPKNELNIAVDSTSLEYDKLVDVIQKNGFNAFNYSGEFSELLNVNPNVGTIGALGVINTSNGNNIVGTIRMNGTYLHSPPILLNMLNQYFQSQEKYNLTNRPFLSKLLTNFDQTIFYAVFLIGPAFVFSSVGLVIEIVNDREIKASNHLRVNGLSFELYYGSMFLVYGFLSVLLTVFQIILIFIFSLPSLTNPYAITVLSGLLLLYIFPSLLFSAIFSYLFVRLESAQAVFSQFASWTGTIGILVVLVLDLTMQSSNNGGLIAHYVFCATNVFYVPFGIFYYINRQYMLCTSNHTCDELSFSDYSGPEFIALWISMLCQIPIFLAILYVVDIAKDGGKIFRLSRSKQRARSHIVPISPSTAYIEDDEDVVKEKDRVSQLFSEGNTNQNCVVAVHELVKLYNTVEGEGTRKKKKSKKIVVNHLSFMVEEAEVFGLLGHNGCGKTTTMKAITAETHPESGQVQLCGYDISSNKSDAFLRLGYCPQHDALWENITLNEHMKLYAIIRGVQHQRINGLIKSFLNGLHILEHSKKKARELSGGTKRKLSYALSMLGSPRIVLLDEPSNGMDPQSKRFLWNTIKGSFKDSRGAILTTHSMEEADVLCSRIAIMVKGTLLCIGSPQHLKSKFGAGYTLEIKLKSQLDPIEDTSGSANYSADDIRSNFDFVTDNFQGCKLNEIFNNRAVFAVPNSTIQSLSQTFELLEHLKQLHNIEEYAFSQTTLEQVFITFAKDNEQNEEH